MLRSVGGGRKRTLISYLADHLPDQITRLKMLKRQMFGRAQLDLLRQRVLFAS